MRDKINAILDLGSGFCVEYYDISIRRWDGDSGRVFYIVFDGPHQEEFNDRYEALDCFIKHCEWQKDEIDE